MPLAVQLQKECRLEMPLAARSSVRNAAFSGVSKPPTAGRLLMNAHRQITAAFRIFLFYRRNFAAHFTAVFHAFPFFRRKYSAHFTEAFCIFAFCRRNYAAHFTVVFYTFALYRRNFTTVIMSPTLRCLFAL